MQTTLGDARLRDAGLSFYRKNGRVSAEASCLQTWMSTSFHAPHASLQPAWTMQGYHMALCSACRPSDTIVRPS